MFLRVLAGVANAALAVFVGYLILRYDGRWRVQETLVSLATYVPVTVALLAVVSNQYRVGLKRWAMILSVAMIAIGGYVIASEGWPLGDLERIWAVMHFAAPVATLVALYPTGVGSHGHHTSPN
jgi:hypothetical protein